MISHHSVRVMVVMVILASYIMTEHYTNQNYLCLGNDLNSLILFCYKMIFFPKTISKFKSVLLDGSKF